MNQKSTCPIWGTPASAETRAGRDGWYVDSPRAGGKYFIAGSAEPDLKDRDEDFKARLTSRLVEQRREGECPEIDTLTLEQAEGRVPLSASERADRLLEYVAEQAPGVGQEFVFVFGSNDTCLRMEAWTETWSLEPSAREGELRFLLESLKERQYLNEASARCGEAGYVLTLKGHARLKEIRSARAETSDGSLNLPFRPRARILQLLGDELIGSPRVAVFELVKNAYDADAGTVSVILKGVESSGASIIVEDDGDGMTLRTIRDIWLVPGHDHRERQRTARKRTRLGRLPLGEKGLGRFAAHKLGNRIELITRAKNEPECVVSIDWTALIQEKELADAKVRVKTRDPLVFCRETTGTRITISGLRERVWTRGEVRRLQRQVTTIASPFNGGSDGFAPRLQVPEHEDWVTGVPDIEALLGRAPWEFRFAYDRGCFDWRYAFHGINGIGVEARETEKSEQPLLIGPDRDADVFGIEQGSNRQPRRHTADASFAEGIGPVRGEFYVFDREPAVLSRLGESHLIRNYLNENGGIRIYRDGIRVYNYGEPGDDWLGLDLRRVNRPTRNLSRNIVVGAVELSLEDSPDLREKTNREGFVENRASRRLKQIVRGALVPLETERQKDKERIRQLTGRGRNPETKRIRQPLKRLRDAARKRDVLDELGPLIDQVENEYDELRETMLRAGLSGVGLAIVFHEIDHAVRSLCGLIEADGERAAIRSRAQELAQVLTGFTDLLRKGRRERHSLKKLVARVLDISRVRFGKHGVRLDCPALEKNFPDTVASFVFGPVLGALNNLLDNAFYWLRVRWPDDGDRAIYMNVNSDLAEGSSIVVADTGPGFADEPEELVRPFFSRRPEGMGLGLYYTGLVMELGGGRLAFPDAREADVPKEFDGAVLALVFPKETQP